MRRRFPYSYGGLLNKNNKIVARWKQRTTNKWYKDYQDGWKYFRYIPYTMDMKNLPAGNYEEQDSFIVGDRIYQGLADAVEPVTGITNGAEKTAQSFLVNGSLELNEDENNEGLDTAVQIMVQVDAYQTLNRPVIDTRWTRVITNYAMIIS